MSARRAAAAVVAAGALVVGACSDSAEPTDPAAVPAATASPDVTPASPAAGTAVAAPSAAPMAPKGTAVRFPTPDGQDLAGTLFGEGPTGVVLAHMRGRDQGTWAAFATDAAAAGHRVLTFDFRGYGQSSGTRDTELATDLRAAIDLMAAEDVNRIVVIGASMGATAAVNVASEAELAGVVSLSAPANFMGLEAAGVASQVGEPLLVVAAEDDAPYADDARAIAEAAPLPTLEILPGVSHGTNLFADHGEALTELLLEFIASRSA